MTTWANLTARLDVIMGDTCAVSYSEALRIQSFNGALQYFAITHTAPLKFSSATADSGGYVDYPNDFMVLAGIENISTASNRLAYWLEPQGIVPGTNVPLGGYVDTGARIQVFGAQTTLNVWYYGEYTPITSSNDVITSPKWAEWALINLSIAYLLNPNIIGQADLRRFQTKREAGAPEDNPPKTLARYYTTIYNEIVARVPLQDRAMLYHQGAR